MPAVGQQKALVTGLTKECQLEMVAESEPFYKSTSDHSIEAGIVLANKNPPPLTSPVLAA